jgi:hypothetical protein
MKSTTLLVTVWTAALVAIAPPLTASADPIVLGNGSSVSGDAWIGQGATRLDRYYSSALEGRWLPTSGDGSLSDGVTLAAHGTAITQSSRLTTSISPTTFSADGGASAEIAGDTSLAVRAFAMSQLTMEFLISEPHAYLFSGQYAGGTEHVISEPFGRSHALGATLYRVVELGPNFTSTVTYFHDSFFSEAATQYSGILEPGRYHLQAFSSVRLDTANTRDSSGFTVNLALAPDPVPEPATLVLLGSGLAVLARRHHRRGRGGHPA